jgi:hypothetical protein
MRTERLVILLVMAVMCLQTPDLWAAGPRIAFQEEGHDLGRVPFGRKVKVHLPFTNMGDGTLIVQAGRPIAIAPRHTILTQTCHPEAAAKS